METSKITMTDYANFYRVMANKSRFSILKVLFSLNDKQSVTELAKIGNIPMTKISDQLLVLRKYSLVNFKKDGTLVYYYVDREKILAIIKSYISLLNLKTDKYYVQHIQKDPFSQESFQLYNVLANETRCEMLIKIANKECFVNELCDMFYLEQPTISMHLHGLQKNKLIASRKQKTWKYYYLFMLDQPL